MAEKNIDGIILDIDGTIWNTTGIVADSWNEAIDKYCPAAPHVTKEELQKQFGKTMKEIADSVWPEQTEEEKFLLMKKCSEEELKALKEKEYDVTYPHVIETIQILSKKLPLFIVSNCQDGYIEIVLEKNKIAQYITDTECYGNTGKGKAENIRLLKERNNLLKPVYVGDTLGDEKACKEAGIDFIWASYGFGKSENYLAQLYDFGKLPALLETLSMKEYAQDNSVPIMMDESADFLCRWILEHDVKNLLEIGTAIGYSAIRFAKVKDDVQVTSIEIDLHRFKEAEKNVLASGLKDRIKLIFGDALYANVEGPFDLIFIDGPKAQYQVFFEKYAPLLSENGVIVTDNLSFHGMVDDNNLTHNYSTKKLVRKIARYVEWLKANEKYETEIFEVGDRISVSRKKDKISVKQ